MNEAMQALQQFVGANRHSLPTLSRLSRQAAEQHKIYIYNVGPYQHMRSLGSLGTYIIPACEKGQAYSKPCMIPGTIFETVYKGLMGEGSMEYREIEGSYVAKDVLGIGQNQDPANAFTRFGVFISEGPVPTEAELAAAREKLKQTYTDRVREADQLYSLNNGMVMVNGMPVSNIGIHHVEACKALGLQRPWAGTSTEERRFCEECGESNLLTAALCKGCKAVLNEELARKRFPGMFAEEKRGPGRPPKVAEA